MEQLRHNLAALRGSLDNEDLPISVASILLTMSVLSGQFTLSRLVPWLPPDLTQVRIITFAGAVVGYWSILTAGWPRLRLPGFGALALLCLYLTLRTLADEPWLALGHIADILLLVAQCAVIVIVAGNRTVRLTIALVAVSCALALIGVQIALQLRPLFGGIAPAGFGWSPLIGAISMYRIEFLAFCVILVAIASDPRVGRWQRLTLILLAWVSLFSTFATLQKGALAGTILTLPLVVIGYLVVKDFRMALLVTGISSAAIATGSLMFGSYIAARVRLIIPQYSEVIDGDRTVRTAVLLSEVGIPLAGAPPTLKRGPASAERHVGTVQVAINQPRSGNFDHASRTFLDTGPTDGVAIILARGETPPVPPNDALSKSSTAEVSIAYCYHKGAMQQVGPADGSSSCFKYSYVDATGRFALWSEALRGFFARPVWGHGLARYSVIFWHPATSEPDPYMYPHNLFLEVMHAGGAVGLLLLVVALALAFGATAPATGGNIPLAAFCVFMLVSVEFTGDFYDSRLLWMALLYLSSLEYFRGSTGHA